MIENLQWGNQFKLCIIASKKFSFILTKFCYFYILFSTCKSFLFQTIWKKNLLLVIRIFERSSHCLLGVKCLDTLCILSIENLWSSLTLMCALQFLLDCRSLNKSLVPGLGCHMSSWWIGNVQRLPKESFHSS